VTPLLASPSEATSHARCPDCGAAGGEDGTGCAEAWHAILAHDHARHQPWGAHHGLAFACHALQHAASAPLAVRAASWQLLVRVYREGGDPAAAVRDLRAQAGRDRPAPDLPAAVADPARRTRPFAVTVADAAAADADAYPAVLEAWARATLDALDPPPAA
jgi:hypothetical protein